MHKPIGPDLPGEIWKPVPGHERLVEISNLGRLRTTPRVVGSEAANGYMQANLPGMVMGKGQARTRKRDHGTFKVPVHWIVCLTFLGPPPTNKHEPNHKDGNKLNNSVGNLEYVTRSENIRHAYKLGLRKRCHTHKLSDEQYAEIRRLYRTGEWTYDQLAVQFGVSSNNIGYVLHRSPRK